MSTITSAKGKDNFRPAGGNESTLDKAKDMAEKAKETISGAASAVGEQASSAAPAIGQKAEHFASSAGSAVKGFGETIKERGPQDGMLGSATRHVGDTLESGGKYLEEAGLSGIAKDLSEVIRRNPVPAVLVGLGIGVLLSRAFRS
jgi:hypothetical protein